MFNVCLCSALLLSKVNLKATDDFADLTQVPNLDLECRLNCYYLSYGFLIFLLFEYQMTSFIPKRATEQMIVSVEMLQQTFLILSR